MLSRGPVVEDTYGAITALLLLVVLLLPYTLPQPSTSPEIAGAGNGNGLSSPVPLQTDPPIVIDSDADMASQAAAGGWPGSGTAGDPYVISGKHINGTLATTCIYVGNVSSHLLIKDNHLVNASIPRASYFPRVAGIHIYQSTNVTVRTNLIENITGVPDENWIGIYIRDSSAVVEDSRISRVNNGIVGAYCQVSVSGNTVENFEFDGIHLGARAQGICENNTLSEPSTGWMGCGVSISGESDVHVANNSVVKTNIGLDVSSSNITVVDNTITACQRGMSLSSSDGSRFLNNTLRCEQTGIWLHKNENLTFRDNTFYGPGFGVNHNYCWPYLDKQDIDTSNNADGLPILYVTHKQDQVITGNWGQVIISHCENITVTGMDIRSGCSGLLCGNTPNLTVRDNVIRSPYKGEARVYPGKDFLFTDNTFENISIDVGSRQYEASISQPGTIEGNHLINGFIRTWYMANVTIANNSVASDYFRGIDAHEVRDMIIEDNDVTVVNSRSGTSGIHIQTDGVTSVHGNSLHNNGFEIWGNEQQTRAFEFGDDNTLAGKPIIYRRDTVSQTYDDRYSQIILVGCGSFTIEGFKATTGNIGVILAYCQDGKVRNCTFDGPSYTGIQSWECDRIDIVGCEFIEGHHSIYSKDDGNLTIKDNRFYGTEDHTLFVYNGDQIVIERNILLDCRWRGIYLVVDGEGSSIIGNYIGNNTELAIQANGPIDIWYNTFVDNAIGSSWGEGQVLGGKSWDDGSRGNYWSDYEDRYPDATNDGVTWDTPYAPNGPRSTHDNHPLVHGWDVFPPVARALDIEVYEGQPFLFNGSLSTDNMGIVEYVWTFTDSTGPVRLTGKVVPYTFHEPGVYNITLTVEDGGGTTASVEFVVTVLPNHPPNAMAGEDVTVDQDTTMTLDGSLSTDDLGIGDWSWSFIYEGGNVTLTGEVVTFTFHAPGVYTVHLEVTDVLGKRGHDQMTVTVLDTEPPTISTNGSIETVLGEVVTLDASLSTDNVGIAGYDWTWEYDGATHSMSGAIARFTFHIPGTYKVDLTLADAAGNRAATEVDVTVLDVKAPVFTWGSDVVHVEVTTLEVALVMGWSFWEDDDASFPEGGTLGYSLSRDGETYSATGVTVTLVLPRGGTYLALLTAVDASGNAADHTFSLVVDWSPEDVDPPVARAGEDMVVHLMDTVVLRGSYTRGDLGLEVWGWTDPDIPDELFPGSNYTFTADAVGEFTYVFWVSDWMANGANDSVVVRVMPRQPVIEILTDMQGPMTKDVLVEGRASGDVDVQRVEYRIDGGDWVLASGTTTWSFTLPAGDLPNGEHTLEVRAWDGFDNGTTGPVPFVVERPPGGGGGVGPWWFLVAGVVAAVVVVAVYLARRDGQG